MSSTLGCFNEKGEYIKSISNFRYDYINRTPFVLFSNSHQKTIDDEIIQLENLLNNLKGYKEEFFWYSTLVNPEAVHNSVLSEELDTPEKWCNYHFINNRSEYFKCYNTEATINLIEKKIEEMKSVKERFKVVTENKILDFYDMIKRKYKIKDTESVDLINNCFSDISISIEDNHFIILLDEGEEGEIELWLDNKYKKMTLSSDKTKSGDNILKITLEEDINE